MKQFYLACIILLAFLSACGKKEVKEDFRINGVTDINIPANGTIGMAIEVEQVNGPQQEVALGISGIPENVNGYFNTWNGTTTFSANVIFEDKGGNAGIYTVNVWGTNKSGLTKEYSLKLTVASKPCAEALQGTYTGGYSCESGPDNPTTIYFYPDPVNNDRLQFSWNGKIAYMVLDCENNTFTIPNQLLTDFSMSGSGTFSKDRKIITLNYKAIYTSNGNTVTCNGSFSKQ